MSTALQILIAVPQVLALFLASTVAFDVVHYALHVAARSRHRVLRAVGGLHEVHHRFLDRELHLHPEMLRRNLLCHVIPEYLTQVSASLALLFVFPQGIVLATLGLQTAVFAGILACRGIDVNHRPRTRIPAYRPLWFCLPEYHALHHAYPRAHYSSWIKLFDQVMGTGVDLVGRRVAILGGATPFGAALASALRREGVGELVALEEVCAGSEAEDAMDAALARCDVLLLARTAEEGAEAPGSRSALIDRFARVRRERLLPGEVWAEAEPGLGARARRDYGDPDFLYRHIVVTDPPSADPSPAARRAARTALFWIRRGFHYVPTRLSLAESVGFLRFRLSGGSRAAA